MLVDNKKSIEFFLEYVFIAERHMFNGLQIQTKPNE